MTDSKNSSIEVAGINATWSDRYNVSGPDHRRDSQKARE